MLTYFSYDINKLTTSSHTNTNNNEQMISVQHINTGTQAIQTAMINAVHVICICVYAVWKKNI